MRRLAIVLLAAAAIGAAVRYWPTDARAIRRTLDAAAEAVSTPAGEGDLQRVARAAGLGRLLAPDAVVQAGPEGPAIRGRDAIVGLAARLRAGGAVAVSLTGVELAVDPGAARATASAAVAVRGGEDAALAGADGAEVAIELRRIDGAWLIARIERVPDLRR